MDCSGQKGGEEAEGGEGVVGVGAVEEGEDEGDCDERVHCGRKILSTDSVCMFRCR